MNSLLSTARKNIILLMAFASCLSWLAAPAHSEELRYISDQFYVPLRSGPSNKHRIIDSSLRTGTKLTLLKTDKEAGYSKVATPKGKEGWIENQYLSAQPIARILLANERARNKSLQQQVSNLQQHNQATSAQSGDLQKKVSALSTDNQKLSNELANLKRISSNAVNLDISNRDLLQKNEMLKIEISELQSENDRLSSKSDKEWFLRGAFAVLIGVVLTIVIPLLKPKPKSSEWT